jgi:HipA-like protein
MRKAIIYRNEEPVGELTEENQHHYIFRYYPQWWADPTKPAISLTLPKTQIEYESETLFPFFFNLLSEGANRKLQSLTLKIDESDHFGYLLATAQSDTVGAVTVKPANTNP